ncbi:hypothetical protein [Escherichia phage vB_EcoS_Uz-1]|nr:hypothetical protein [Escherichia phage vB_EcoS_Uz-1]
MASIDSLTVCNSRQARNFIIRALKAGNVPFLTSSPGMGKSAIIRSIAEEFGMKLIDHRLSTSAPEDLSGLPFRNGDRAEFIPFADLFPIEGDKIPEGYNGWLLFLDEFPSARKEVIAAAYKLILDRMTGQKKLHPNVMIICAGNKATDRAIVNPLGTAMQSRVVHFEMELNFDIFVEDVMIPQQWMNVWLHSYMLTPVICMTSTQHIRTKRSVALVPGTLLTKTSRTVLKVLCLMKILSTMQDTLLLVRLQSLFNLHRCTIVSLRLIR